MVGILIWIGVAAFGALGAFARFRVDAVVSERFPTDFPIGTFVVNISGTIPLGVLVGASISQQALMVLGTGFLGGYTTFSTWMVETERLSEVGRVAMLLGNLGLSLAIGVTVAGLAWHLGHGWS